MKANLLKRRRKERRHHNQTTRMASQLASMIYRDNQNMYVWGKDRQEDLMKIFNKSVD